ncbi:MAG: hypothetical protein NTZ63_06905 [Candidatus Omnitrophica bacterium]|nr:hypothetical protein [Candidatus Omnitrophota bacterium]
MGVIHKLKPKINEFIIFHKKNDSSISCRKLTTLILENFQSKVSKSSINKIIKEAGLSAPIGRTPKKKKLRIPMPTLPILLEEAPKKELQLTVDREPERELLLKNEEERLVKEGKERARLEEEARQALEEAAKKEEETRWAKLAEEERLSRESQEKARIEEEDRKRQEALRAIAEEERLAKEAQEKARLLEEEKLKKEAELRKAQEEAAVKAESARRIEEEGRKRQEALRFLAEEEKIKALEAAKKAEAELLAQEAKSASLLNISRFAQIENTGIILLKAVDSVMGGSQLIAKAIKEKLSKVDNNLSQIVENLIFLPLLQERLDPAIRNSLLDYLNGLENIKLMSLDISRVIDSVLQEVRCVKIIFSDGGSAYLDGQLYSAWSSEHVPYDFSSPMIATKNYLDKYFVQGKPMLLFAAPGYDVPSAEFFNLLSALEAKTSTITECVLYGNKSEELEALPVSLTKKHFLIFGLWPWQFTTCRKVKYIGEFKLVHLEAQNRDFYIADIEIDLQHPGLSRQFSLTGCAVKTSLSEKTKLVVLSNFPKGLRDAVELATDYLNHWPNLDEAFQDYSRKIEVATYTANSQRFAFAENQGLSLGRAPKIKDLLLIYLKALDTYVRRYLQVSGLEDKGAEFLIERFYSLNVQLAKTSESYLAKFILPPEYAFGKDLGYACRRMNEKEAFLSSGMRLYLS